MTEIDTSAEALENDVLAQTGEVHTDPDAQPVDVPEGLGPARKSPAKWAYERLALYIKNFEEQLDSDHEAAMGFTGGDAGIMRIEGIGYFDPDIVTFYGSDPAGEKVQMIQHVTQLNVMLRAMPKTEKAAEPRRIGFELSRALDSDNAPA